MHNWAGLGQVSGRCGVEYCTRLCYPAPPTPSYLHVCSACPWVQQVQLESALDAAKAAEEKALDAVRSASEESAELAQEAAQQVASDSMSAVTMARVSQPPLEAG